MASVKSVYAELKRYKDGILAGIVSGIGLAWYLSSKGAEMMALNSPGYIDQLVTSVSAEQMLFLKMAIVYATFGALIGYVLSKYVYKKRK